MQRKNTAASRFGDNAIMKVVMVKKREVLNGFW